MKKLLLKTLSVMMALMLFNAQTFALAPPFMSVDFSDDAQEIIDFNDQEIYNAFASIETITSAVQASDITYEELASAEDLSLVSSASAIPVSNPSDVAPPLGIPSFLWGCVFGIIGLALVYFLTGQDADQTRKALWGCILGTLIWGLGGWGFNLY